MRDFRSFIFDERGQGTAEYAILISCIVVVVIVAINALGMAIKGSLNNSLNQINII